MIESQNILFRNFWISLCNNILFHLFKVINDTFGKNARKSTKTSPNVKSKTTLTITVIHVYLVHSHSRSTRFESNAKKLIHEKYNTFSNRLYFSSYLLFQLLWFVWFFFVDSVFRMSTGALSTVINNATLRNPDFTKNTFIFLSML